MARTNTKTTRSHVYVDERLAGGYGPRGAKQPDEQQLRRLVMACLLWEDIAYANGKSVADAIKELVPKVAPDVVGAIAIEARYQQKLRHVPLFLCREMARHPSHRKGLADVLAKVINRPDELAEFVSMYWKDNDGKKTLAKQVKKGLAAAFQKFDAYQISKWDRQDRDIKLRDVMFLCHPKPAQGRESLYKQLAEKTLAPADTWEVGLSAAKTTEDKRAVWERLISEKKLGALAFLKNLRNMQQASVSRDAIAAAFDTIRPTVLLPIDFIRAVQFAPDWTRELEAMMLCCAAEFPKLPGWTVLVIDVSGSMNHNLSEKTEFTRIDAAAAMAVLAAEMCEHVAVYATAGNDYARTHATSKVRPFRGFALADAIRSAAKDLGGGGIFTRQCLEYIRGQERETPDRIIIFSDSQDCDHPNQRQPKPFGKANYIVDVSSHIHGVNYDGVWSAEISGWSTHFLTYIAALEGQLTESNNSIADGDSQE
jgi:hypothetical protein